MDTTGAQHKFSSLAHLFNQYFSWHKARINFLILFITALCKRQTVNFERLAEAMDSPAQVTSCLRRIQRFFAAFTIDKDKLATLLFSLLPRKTNLTLSIDRTNWQFGKTDINIFMLSVCYEGIAFPLLWQMLDHKGNSNAAQRIDLIKRFVRLFGKDCIAAIVADREFVGCEWMGWLELEHIPFHIRIKENMWFTKPGTGERIRIRWILQGCAVGVVYDHPKMLYLDKTLVYVSGMKIKGGEYLILVSYDKQQQSLLRYKERWQIETMFKAFKTNGFNLEDTHLRASERLDKLIATVSIAFSWAYKVGIWAHHHLKAIGVKKHGRRAHSYFSYGLRLIATALLAKPELLDTVTQVLSCT